MPIYTTMNGNHYIAEISKEDGKHLITIKNKIYKTVVDQKEVVDSAQVEAQGFLRLWDSKKPFTNDGV